MVPAVKRAVSLFIRPAPLELRVASGNAMRLVPSDELTFSSIAKHSWHGNKHAASAACNDALGPAPAATAAGGAAPARGAAADSVCAVTHAADATFATSTSPYAKAVHAHAAALAPAGAVGAALGFLPFAASACQRLCDAAAVSYVADTAATQRASGLLWITKGRNSAAAAAVARCGRQLGRPPRPEKKDKPRVLALPEVAHALRPRPAVRAMRETRAGRVMPRRPEEKNKV